MDQALAEYIAGLKDWDAAVFELGVNVLEEWTDRQLYDRAYQWIDTVKRAQPEKPVFVTDFYYNHYDFEENGKSDAFRKKIKECTAVLEKSMIGCIIGMELRSWERFGGCPRMDCIPRTRVIP